MNDFVFKKVTGTRLASLNTANVKLKDYRRVQVKNKPYPAVYYCVGSVVDALLIYITSKDMEMKLDAFEDEGNLYNKTLVTVDHFGSVECYCYVWANGITDLDVSKEWNYDTFIKNLPLWSEMQ